MLWRDNRGYDQIQRATNVASKTGKCTRYCDKSTAAGGLGYCCDGMWLPTLKFLSAQAKVIPAAKDGAFARMPWLAKAVLPPNTLCIVIAYTPHCNVCQTAQDHQLRLSWRHWKTSDPFRWLFITTTLSSEPVAASLTPKITDTGITLLTKVTLRLKIQALCRLQTAI